MNDDVNGIEADPRDNGGGAMGDAELDALIARFGSDYNKSLSATPNEEMWHAIQNASAKRPARSWLPISLAAAAVVVLAAGIGIGVELHSRGIFDGNSRASTAVIANNTGSRSATIPPSDSVDRKVASVSAEADTATAASIPESSARISENSSDGSVSLGTNNAARSTAYSLATVRHFTAVEALLTSYQTTQRDANSDAQLASWARSLLSQTRLLLDSPAASDPVRRKLLQDLELILVQMTQLSPANSSIERESLDGSMKHSAVITRLRTAVPAGAATTL